MCCNNGCGGGGNCCWIIILLIIIWRRLGWLRMRLQQWRLWLQQRLRLLSIQSAPHP